MTEGVEDDRNAIHMARCLAVNANAVFDTSELTSTEVLVHPFRLNHRARIERYHPLMTEFVALFPVSREVLFVAARLRADTPALRAPDAIHTATAILAKTSVFIIGDRGIKPVAGKLLIEHV